MNIKTSLVALSLAALALYGCAAPSGGDDAEGPAGEVAQALNSNPVVRVTNGTASTTGVLVAPDVVVVPGTTFPSSQDPRRLSVVDSWQVSTAVVDIVFHPQGDLALVKLASAGAAATLDDATTAASLVGREIECRAFGRPSLKLYGYASAGDELMLDNFPAAPGAGFVAGPLPTFADVGASCAVTRGDGRVVGVLAGTRHLVVSRAVTGWLPGAQNLFGVRAQPSARPFSLYYLRNPSDADSKNCLDVPSGTTTDHASVNQFPCHFGPAQQFYLDYRSDPSFPALVSATSGLCVDIPWASRVSGTDLQQTTCNGQPNQRWDIRLFTPQGVGAGYFSRNGANLCLSGVATNGFGPSLPVKTSTCRTGTLTNNEQRWFIRWS